MEIHYLSEKAKEIFKNNKVKLQTLTAAILVAGTLVGCGQTNCNSNNMSEYITDSLVITTTDGEKQIVKKWDNWNCTDHSNKNHYHYRDVVTGNYYSDSLECMDNIGTGIKDTYPTYLEIQTVETLADYLTDEELSKLIKNEFTNDDYANLVVRIKFSTNEEVKTK